MGQIKPQKCVLDQTIFDLLQTVLASRVKSTQLKMNIFNSHQ